MKIDPNSDTWASIVGWAKDQKAEAAEELTTLGCDPRQADVLRGRIAQLDDLQALSDPHILVRPDKVRY